MAPPPPPAAALHEAPAEERLGGLAMRVACRDATTTEYVVTLEAPPLRQLRSVLASAVLLLAFIWMGGPPLAQAVCAVITVAAAVALAAAVTEESVTLVQGLGAVLAARRRLLGRPASRFVPVERIRSVVINEGVGASRVTCYLALMVEGADRLEVAFPSLLPRLPLLTLVYRDLQARLRCRGGAGG